MKLLCIKLKLKLEFQYNIESPFGIDLSWENPSINQIEKVRDYVIKQFNDEIERISF